MSKVKPLLPPKPNYTRVGMRLIIKPTAELMSDANDGCPSLSQDKLDGVIIRDGEDLQHAEAGFGSVPEIITSSERNSFCHGFPKLETDLIAKQGPSTAPKPKSRTKNAECSKTLNCTSDTFSHLEADNDNLVVSSDVKNKTTKQCKDINAPLTELTSKQGLPVKPPRPKKVKKLSFDSQIDLCAIQKASLKTVTCKEQEMKNHTDNEDSDKKDRSEKTDKHQPVVNRVKKTVLTDGLIARERSSSSSCDSGRLFRSSSYEKALDECILEANSVKTESPCETGLVMESVSDILNDGSTNSCQQTEAKVKLVREKQHVNLPFTVEDESNNTHIISVSTVRNEPQEDQNKCIRPTRFAPAPPSKPTELCLKKKPRSKDSNKSDAGVLSVSTDVGVHDEPRSQNEMRPVCSLGDLEAHDRSRTNLDYIDLHSKDICVLSPKNPSVVKRPSLENIKSTVTAKLAHVKRKHSKTSSDTGQSSRDQDQRHTSVFYYNITSRVNSSKSHLASDYEQASNDSDGYLMPVADSFGADDLQGISGSTKAGKSISCYENVSSAVNVAHVRPKKKKVPTATLR